MLDMALDSAKLFFTGKLFQNYPLMFRQIFVGSGVGAIVLLFAAQVLPVWVAALLGGMVAGALQPILFKNLRYR